MIAIREPAGRIKVHCEDCGHQYRAYTRKNRGNRDCHCPRCGSTSFRRGWPPFPLVK